MVKYVTIYGERCSGTNYLEELIKTNFKVKITWKYAWKHFFGFNDLSASDDTLFIGIIRNPYDWLNSFYREQFHLPQINTSSVECFLNNEFYSIDGGAEIMHDRNIYTKERYKNIFEMRHTKNKFLIEDMPLLVKNYILITYESLLNDFKNTIIKIKNKGLHINHDIKFPLNVTYYKQQKNEVFIKKSKKKKHISKSQIVNKLNMHYEKKLFADYI